MAKVEWYRLVDDAEQCRYLGTFAEDDQNGVKCRFADALARFGVSSETARKIINSLENDYATYDRDQPICCEEHERFLAFLIETADNGSPIRPGNLPQHGLH